MKKLLILLIPLFLLSSCIEIRQDVKIFVEDRDVDEEETNVTDKETDISIEAEVVK